MNFAEFYKPVAATIFLLFDVPSDSNKGINLPEPYGTIVLMAVLLLLVLLGLLAVAIDNYLTQHYRRFNRLNIGLLGAGIISVGIGFLNGSGTISEFIGTFLCATGAQIFLWAVGIRLELLSNTTPDLE